MLYCSTSLTVSDLRVLIVHWPSDTPVPSGVEATTQKVPVEGLFTAK